MATKTSKVIRVIGIDELKKASPVSHQEVTFDDQLFQEYQAGYHQGYEHGIRDASELTAEDIKFISDLEFYELNNGDNSGKSLEDVRAIVAKKFNEQRYKNKK